MAPASKAGAVNELAPEPYAAVADLPTGNRRTGRPARLRDLPTYYYHAHFLEMLAFVDAHYDHVLDARQRTFRTDFESLSFPAQCLYVRLLNRRGRLFARPRLRYPEIANIDAALLELTHAGFAAQPDPACVDELLNLLTRAQLLAVLRAHLQGLRSNLKKVELVELARDRFAPDTLFDLLPREGIVMQGRSEETSFLLFLFFGRVQESLSSFTMRDLGLVRVHEGADGYEARFSERDDARHAYFFAKRLDRLHRDPRCSADLYQEIDTWPAPQASNAADFRDQLALDLGRALEADSAAALRVYQLGESVQCSERVMRLLVSSGRRDEARTYLERCIAAPSCDEEALLAADIYARKFAKKRTSKLTDQLRAAEVVEVDEAHRGAPERAVVRWFHSRGQRAFRVENSLWRTFFGLLFWDLLFDADTAGLHSPFERLPSSLLERRFLVDNAAAIQDRLALLDDVATARRHLVRVCGEARYSERSLSVATGDPRCAACPDRSGACKRPS